jgi:hypothetical protein
VVSVMAVRLYLSGYCFVKPNRKCKIPLK